MPRQIFVSPSLRDFKDVNWATYHLCNILSVQHSEILVSCTSLCLLYNQLAQMCDLPNTASTMQYHFAVNIGNHRHFPCMTFQACSIERYRIAGYNPTAKHVTQQGSLSPKIVIPILLEFGPIGESNLGYVLLSSSWMIVILLNTGTCVNCPLRGYSG